MKTREEIDNEGWMIEERMSDSSLRYTFNDLKDTLQELTQYKRGCLTGCHTYNEMADRLDRLANEMKVELQELRDLDLIDKKENM